MMAQLVCFLLTMVVLIDNVFIQDARVTTSPSIARNPVQAVYIEQFGALDALRELSREAKIPIGFQERLSQKEANVVLDFRGGTLADALNLFVSKDPVYTWLETAGHIIHISGKQDGLQLSDVVLAYPGAVKRTRKEIWQDLAKRPEVATWMNSTQCSRAELMNGREFDSNNDPISIDPGSITVARLLDAVAVKSGENFWAILQSAPGDPCRVYIMAW